MSTGAQTLTAAAVHVCTRCGEVIGRGDTYYRTALPPWVTGTGCWLVLKDCVTCARTRGHGL